MQNIINPQNEDEDIQNSQYEEIHNQNSFTPFESGLQDNSEYHYIDILSIIQLINTQKRMKSKKRFFFIIYQNTRSLRSIIQNKRRR